MGLNENIVRYQVAMNKPGLMQMTNLQGKLFETCPFLF